MAGRRFRAARDTTCAIRFARSSALFTPVLMGMSHLAHQSRIDTTLVTSSTVVRPSASSIAA